VLEGLLDFGIGTAIGGLMMSAGWGLFWLLIGMVGLARRTCGWRVVLNSLVVSAVTILFVSGLVWLRGPAHSFNSAFTIGLCVMPLVLVWFGLREAPDGQRTGARMLGGVRHLMDELMGKHHACRGCDHEHEHGGGA